MPSCAPHRPRSTRQRRGSTAWSTSTCCGRGTSPRSARICARTHRAGSLVSSDGGFIDPFTLRDGAVGVPPRHYGNPLGEQRELAAGRAIVDLSDRDVLSITGPDRLSWLDSLTSQRLIGLAPGVAAETLLLDPSGRVEYAARVLDDGETTWLLMDAGTGAGFFAFLSKMRFMLRVEALDRSSEFATIGTVGEVPAALSAATAEGNGIPLTWHDPWRSIVAGGFPARASPRPAGRGWRAPKTLPPPS